MELELLPVYDSRKSFYGKARVRILDGEKILLSYGTPVARIVDGSLALYPAWTFSATTLRHVKEFARQAGYPKMSKQEMADFVSNSGQ